MIWVVEFTREYESSIIYLVRANSEEDALQALVDELNARYAGYRQKTSFAVEDGRIMAKYYEEDGYELYIGNQYVHCLSDEKVQEL